MDRSCNCPQCGSPDVFVVRRPSIVECLVCGCTYQFDELAGRLTEAEAADVAAECIRAIEWQTDNIIANPRSDDIETADMIAAVTPRHPATIRIIDAMKQGSASHRAMKELLPPGTASSFGVVLLSTTCQSIARNLARWGFQHHADQIMAALNRSDLAATGH